MAHDELSSKLFRDAIAAASDLAEDARLIAATINDGFIPDATAILLGGGNLRNTIEFCTKLRLLRDLDREGK